MEELILLIFSRASLNAFNILYGHHKNYTQYLLANGVPGKEFSMIVD